MFTVKFYRNDGFTQVIMEADSLSILRPQAGGAEITLHRAPGPNGEYRDVRYDVTDCEPATGMPETFERAIVENANGKTTEVISLAPRLKQAE